jgi:hypothetical protein
MEDGALVADKKSTEGSTFLVTKEPYNDVQIKAEIWVNAAGNSGIFVRCADPTKVSARTCYEFNVWDTRPDPTYGTGAIVDVAKVDPMPKAADKWNAMEITVQGPHLVFMFNGTKTADVQDTKFTSGHFALQYAGGVVKFRNVQVKRL